MQQAKPHADLFGRVIGTLILLAGIAMLAFVFKTANDLFYRPITGLEFLGSKSAAPPPANIGAAALEFVKQLVYLGLMTVVGSLCAGKGITLYIGAVHWADGHRPVHVEPAAAPAASTAESPKTNAAAKTQSN